MILGRKTFLFREDFLQNHAVAELFSQQIDFTYKAIAERNTLYPKGIVTFATEINSKFVSMKTDIEIAREIELKPIQDIAQDLGIDNANVEPYGHHIAKIGLGSLRPVKIAKSNLILVTVITPNKAGVGKTTVSIGLALGLNQIGKRAIVGDMPKCYRWKTSTSTSQETSMQSPRRTI